MARARLFTTEKAATGPRSKCRDLVPLPREQCLDCSGSTRRESLSQPALFRHGGYGGTLVTTFLLCTDPTCGAVRCLGSVEVRPERRSA